MTDDPKKIQRVVDKLHSAMKEEELHGFRVQSINLVPAAGATAPRALGCTWQAIPDGNGGFIFKCV